MKSKAIRYLLILGVLAFGSAAVFSKQQRSAGKLALYVTQLPLEESRSVPINWINWISKVLPNSLYLDRLHITQGASLAVLVDEKCIEDNKSRIYSEEKREGFLKPEVPQSTRSSLQTHRVITQGIITIGDLRKSAMENPCVKMISHNLIASADSGPEQGDPMYQKQSHLNELSATLADDFFFDSKTGIKTDVVIAIVDTGIDLNHPDLHDNIWINKKELGGLPGVDDDHNGYVDDVNGYNFPNKKGDPSHLIVNDHGTHVAGLAAAIRGNGTGGAGLMGRHIRIMALNVFGDHWGSDTVDIDEAIRYAADNGANVINVSVGGAGHSDTTEAAIRYAIEKGSVVVASSGNESLDIGNEFYFPASYAREIPGMLSVGATDVQGGTLCGFSNYGAESVKILAPGCDKSAPKEGLLSTRNGGGYGYRHGTSMAAPLVSAAMALTYGYVRDASGVAPTPSDTEKMFLRGSPVVPALEKYVLYGKVANLKNLSDSIQQNSKNP